VRIGDMERQLELESQETFAEQRDTRARFDALHANVVAEIALQQRRSAEAELLEAARDWAVLRVAALMVGTADERQRTGQQEPLMKRAGELRC
jgi:chromosome segregation protein